MKIPKTNTRFVLSLFLLIVVIFLAYKSRTANIPNLVADYDPWFQYRHAKEILENNMKLPKWDLLSFATPGRPFPDSAGWMYTMIFFYKVFSLLSNITFMETVILSPAITVALGAAAAFMLGKELSNKWGGLVTAIFITLAPTLIGVSVAGYADTDAIVVFYSFACLFTMFLAMRKKKIPYIILAVVTNLLFLWSWWFGWYIQFFLLLLIPVIFGYKFIVQFLKNRRQINILQIVKGLKEPFLPLVIIILIINIITLFLGMGTVFEFFMVALGFKGGGGVIVNVSVAELQPINILTKGGFRAVAGRVGSLPMNITVFGLPILVGYKIFKKEKFGFEELFLFMWTALTFYMILNGVRFSLLFAVAVASSAGYVIGNLVRYVKENENLFLKSTVLGIITFFMLTYTSQNMAFAMNSGGFDISHNWVSMLDWLKENADSKAIVATWWDPGHIITGYTGLRVHGDGAHCGPSECIIYSHNDRIQDMGRTMSTSNETEAVELLQKYMQLTPEQCETVKEKYGNIVPEEACESASEMYFISSNDLIGKFTWMNYFGGFRAPIDSVDTYLNTPGVCCASTPKSEEGQLACGEFANQGRGVWVWCPWIFSFEKTQKDQEGNDVFIYNYADRKIAIIQREDQIIPIFNNRYLINKMVFFSQEGQAQILDFSDNNTTMERIDGMIWAEPGLRSLIYFSPSIKDSIFTRTFFFNGEGLEHFELVYSNPEIRLYKVNFENN